jgi:hypothetical protein
MNAKRIPAQVTLDGIPPLPPERAPGRPTKADAQAHAAAVRKAVMAGRPAGKKAGHARAKVAADNAGATWELRAESLMVEYADTVGSAGFLTEEARTFAIGQGHVDQGDGRAWGHVAKRLERAGKLEACGAAHDRYGSLKTKWRRK